MNSSSDPSDQFLGADDGSASMLHDETIADRISRLELHAGIHDASGDDTAPPGTNGEQSYSGTTDSRESGGAETDTPDSSFLGTSDSSRNKQTSLKGATTDSGSAHATSGSTHPLFVGRIDAMRFSAPRATVRYHVEYGFAASTCSTAWLGIAAGASFTWGYSYWPLGSQLLSLIHI